MKVELSRWDLEVYGITLTAESEEDNRALKRFWKSGVKVNAVTERGKNNSSLQLTFADMIENP